jgi:predicted ABC-type ATPase
MPRPRMVVVAGPPGSGKTSRFPLNEFGVDYFNADMRAAELNNGFFRGISKEIRSQVNAEFEQWVRDHISDRKSFALETTLRSTVTFEQAHSARDNDFWTSMYYISSGSAEESIKRITSRAYHGGHSASETLVREIYRSSTRNLVDALDYPQSGLDYIEIYDNSVSLAERRAVQHIMTIEQGHATHLAQSTPDWIENLLSGTEFDINRLREEWGRGEDRNPIDFDR